MLAVSRPIETGGRHAEARDKASARIVFRFAFAIVSKTSGHAAQNAPVSARIFVLATY
ncbi:hypothetical protein V4890_17740 [Ralstonia solanacearum species complex bacterium KE056]|uniref:hypothetical protein n=1 Tax=Ralstonia solanacearum species complex bacterium KE056 TaxID=3119585 RepID=UPI002FC3CA22